MNEMRSLIATEAKLIFREPVTWLAAIALPAHSAGVSWRLPRVHLGVSWQRPARAAAVAALAKRRAARTRG